MRWRRASEWHRASRRSARRCDQNRRRTRAGDTNSICGTARQIHRAPAHIRTAIVDSHHDRAAVGCIKQTHPRAKWQRARCSCQPVLVIAFHQCLSDCPGSRGHTTKRVPYEAHQFELQHGSEDLAKQVTVMPSMSRIQRGRPTLKQSMKRKMLWSCDSWDHSTRLATS